MGMIMSLIPLVLRYMNPVRMGRVVKLVRSEIKMAKELLLLSRQSDKIDKGVEMANDLFLFS